MVNPNLERVDAALQQLVGRLLPAGQDLDDAAAERQFFQALEYARESLSTDSAAASSLDATEVVRSITERLRDSGHYGKALQVTQLCSRLLDQPVLSQKGSILAFLYHLTAQDMSSAAKPGQVHVQRLPASPLDPDVSVRRLHSRSSRLSSPGTLSPPSRDRDRRRAVDSPHANTVPSKTHVALHDLPPRPSQAALLRDLPFVLQGLSSTLMTFSDHDTLHLPPNLPIPIISILHTLAEPALLYRRLNAFVQSVNGDLTVQSLQSAISDELRSYLGLIATLEAQIRSLSSDKDEPATVKAGITLKRCVIWTREATMGLRLMNVIIQDSRDKQGGEVISNIHKLATLHGDPFVQTFANRLLTAVARPFYNMLRQWIYSGLLEDPYQEFFVRKNPEPLDSGSSVWENDYVLHAAMIPSIIRNDFAQKVFLIGKSLNFIRHTCSDSAWVDAYSIECSNLSQSDDIAALSASVDQAYTKTMAHLLVLMEQKFRLFEHLSALKKYLLLGQGDFVSLLMESLASSLELPANSQYRHNLTAQLDHAVRNSNAQSESPDVLKRLDARMLELSHGPIGWDVFTLEYRIDSPLDVVITPWASKQYLKIFNFLWRVKRVEFSLGQTCRKSITGARGVLKSLNKSLASDWKVARLGMSAMVHFLCQLQYYILFEVIEASWEGLQLEIRKPGATLDSLIAAHNKYLQSITRKGLLASQPSSSNLSSTHFTIQLHELLKLILAYKDAVETLYSHSVAVFTQRQNQRGHADRTAADADTEMSDAPAPLAPALIKINGAEADVEEARVKGSSLRALDAEFRDRVNVFLGDLAHQPETDMRFLGVVMNFNETYRPARRRRDKERVNKS